MKLKLIHIFFFQTFIVSTHFLIERKQKRGINKPIKI
jgi:hypothetical protein